MSPMKFDFQWPAAAIFCVVFATLGALVFFGKVHPEALIAMLAWLAPAPYQGKPSPGGPLSP
jgi:hypothetical protein